MWGRACHLGAGFPVHYLQNATAGPAHTHNFMEVLKRLFMKLDRLSTRFIWALNEP